MLTVEEATARFFEAAAQHGMVCPCCLRFGKYYKRRLNGSMVRSLMWLVQFSKLHPGTWIDVANTAPRWLLRTKQLATCRYWRLIEAKPHVPDEKKCNGFWKPTELGVRFIYNQIVLPSYVIEYKTKVLQRADIYVSVVEALGVKHNYLELLNSCLAQEG
jgi:hypothetical protein